MLCNEGWAELGERRPELRNYLSAYKVFDWLFGRFVGVNVDIEL